MYHIHFFILFHYLPKIIIMPEHNHYYANIYTYCDECEEEIEGSIDIIEFVTETFAYIKVNDLINDLIKFHHEMCKSTPGGDILIDSIYRTLSQLKENKKINIKYL